jgi:hypothetical protein
LSSEVVGRILQIEGVEPLKERVIDAIVQIRLGANGVGKLPYDQFNSIQFKPTIKPTV